MKNSLKDLYTPHRIIHFFSARNQTGEEKKKYDEARNKIKSEIECTKMRDNFYRYLSWVIQSVPLKIRVDEWWSFDRVEYVWEHEILKDPL